MQGEEPDYSKRKLFETLEKGDSLKWTMMVQVGPTNEMWRMSLMGVLGYDARGSDQGVV